MASNSGWSKGLPSGTSNIAVGDDDIRSNQSVMQASWEQEHYLTDGSANSAGYHKEGSARAYVQATAPTAVAPKGQLWLDTDNDRLFVAEAAGTGSWTTVIGEVTLASAQTFTALQEFTSGISSSIVTSSRFGKPSTFFDIVSFTSTNPSERTIAPGNAITFTFAHSSGLSLNDVVHSSFTYDNGGGSARIVWVASVQQSDGSVILTVHNADNELGSATIHAGNVFRFLGFRSN